MTKKIFFTLALLNFFIVAGIKGLKIVIVFFLNVLKNNLENSFELTISQIKRLFNKTKFAISAEETRYYLNGIYFHTITNGPKSTLRCVATDGHRLAKTELDLTNVINISGIILPRKFILQLDRILGDFEGKVKII